MRLLFTLLIFPVLINSSPAFAQKDQPWNGRSGGSTEGGAIEMEDAYELKPSRAPSLLLQETVPLQEDTAMRSKNRVFVMKIKIEGNTAFTEEELSEKTSRYENREITFEELQDLRQKITLHYIDRGYINSGAVIPDQQIIDGVVVVKVIEGRLSHIEIEGNKYFRSRYIKDRLERSAIAPLNIHRLQQALQILQQDVRIRRINATLDPGIMPGEAVLKIRVEEESPFSLVLDFSNTQSPSIGSYLGGVTLAHNNALGFGDVLQGYFNLSEGTEEYGVSYTVPVTSYDTAISFYFKESQSTVIDEEFEPLDIESRTESYGVRISHPFHKTPAQEFNLAFTGEVRRNETFLLGRPFSFTDNPDNVTRLTALRFLQEWINRGSRQSLAARSLFSIGIDAFQATVSEDGADGEFFSWLGQILWIKQYIHADIQTVFRADAHLANDSLLPMEKFPVGGMSSVRGYRENELVRDNGVVSSLEVRLPLIRNRRRDVIVQFAPFADMGWSWNAKGETPGPKNIQSVGAGIRWSIDDNRYFNLFAGHALREIRSSDHDLQDEGIHFQLVWPML